jgi:hypothetical protein
LAWPLAAEPLVTVTEANPTAQAVRVRQSLLINQSKRKTSNVQNLTHLGHEHQAPDHEATQPMMGY